MLPARFRYIAVEGAIGVGKTTLAKALARYLDARFIGEDAAGNPFLGSFYADMRTFAFQTQIFFLVSRYRQQREILQADLFHPVTVTDYIFEKDSVFASICLDEEEMKLYRALQSMLAPKVPKPDLVVFLQSSTDALMDRIAKRRARFEDSLDRKYLERVVESYRHFFFDYKDAPLLVVDTEAVNVSADRINLAGLVEQMARMESGTQYYTPTR